MLDEEAASRRNYRSGHCHKNLGEIEMELWYKLFGESKYCKEL